MWQTHRDVWLQRSALELTSKTSCSATQSTGQTRTAVFTGTAARAPARVCLHTRGSEQQRTATRLLTSRTLDCSRVCVCIYPQLHAQRDYSPRPGRSPRRPPLTRSSRDHGAAPLNANEAAQFPAPAPADCVKTSAGPF